MAIKINLMPQKEGTVARKEQQRPFYFLIILIFFIISLVIYFGVYYYNNILLKKQLDDVEKKNTEIQEEILQSAATEDFSTVAAAVTKGNNIQSILSARLYGSKIYELLEKLTIKTVSYNKFSEKINSDNTITVSVDGEADSSRELAKQFMVFKNSQEIKEVIFREATIEKNSKISFSFALSFDSKAIAARPIITLFGFSAVEITVGSDYSDAGAAAVDEVGGPLAVMTTGSVNTNVAGAYILTYSATNAIGNSATAVRTVNVIAP